MILLTPSQYNMVIEPLLNVPINILYPRAVVEKRSVQGWVYVDNIDNPQSFYIIHPCGMSLVFGKPLTRYPKSYKLDEWLLSYPNIEDEDAFFDNLNSRVYKYTRVHFKFNPDKYVSRREDRKEYTIVRIDREMFNSLKGPIIPKFYWDNADDFFNIGMGFALMRVGIPIATAFSTSVVDDKIDIAVDVNYNYRGRGFGTLMGDAMVEFCLLNNCEPVWGTFSYNHPGTRVGEKLGFDLVEQLPCYGLL